MGCTGLWFMRGFPPTIIPQRSSWVSARQDRWSMVGYYTWSFELSSGTERERGIMSGDLIHYCIQLTAIKYLMQYNCVISITLWTDDGDQSIVQGKSLNARLLLNADRPKGQTGATGWRQVKSATLITDEIREMHRLMKECIRWQNQSPVISNPRVHSIHGISSKYCGYDLVAVESVLMIRSNGLCLSNVVFIFHILSPRK